jgi:hypothetical protein
VGAAADSAWRFRWSHWHDTGLWGRNERTGEELRVAFGTPLLGWPVWRAIHLPGDLVLFQLGRDQLCLLDVASRRVSLIARGHGPVAVED